VSDADALLCMHTHIDRTVLQALRRCKVIVRFGTGLDNIDLRAAAEAGIPVVGIHDYCTVDVADHTMALLLCWNRKVLEYHRFVEMQRWNERTQTTGNWGCGPITRLSDQTLGLLGFGHIGRAVARRARAFGMRVLAYSRNPDLTIAAQLDVELVDRPTVLAAADYISLHLPLSDETRHFINGGTISLMKRGAVVINTARGGLIEEGALAEALRSGRLGGALLDVYQQAPLPIEHPFRSLPNVIFSAHVGFYSEQSLADLRRLAAEAVSVHLP
jgi:D-3-phosphoglycerate dehydrogenase